MSTTARVNTRRNNQPPSCVLDNNNSEAPDALQQQAAAGTSDSVRVLTRRNGILLSYDQAIDRWVLSARSCTRSSSRPRSGKGSRNWGTYSRSSRTLLFKCPSCRLYPGFSRCTSRCSPLPPPPNRGGGWLGQVRCSASAPGKDEIGGGWRQRKATRKVVL
ncbi:hypothetical protein DFH09DRAFT_1147297 [Mycena vulgaris]|nr:hypothetical protein DFH09DRAFT_1147297 [Mycena vulgaris]